MFKYIIVRNQEQKEVAILFSKTLVHKQVASLHSSMFGPWVVSAGFVTLSPEGYVAVAAIAVIVTFAEVGCHAN